MNVLILVVVTCAWAMPAQGQDAAAKQSFRTQTLPALPNSISGAFVGVHDGTILFAGGTTKDRTNGGTAGVYALRPAASQWESVGELAEPRWGGAAASSADGVILVGGSTGAGATANVTLLSFAGGRLQARELPKLPGPLERGAATVLGRKVYVVAAGEGPTPRFLALDLAADSPDWERLPIWPGGRAVAAPALVGLHGTLYLFAAVDGRPVAYSYEPRAGWQERAAPPRWPAEAAPDAAVPYGHSHVFAFGAAAAGEVPAYHTITNTWLTFPLPAEQAAAAGSEAAAAAVARGKQSILITGNRVLAVEPAPIPTNYGWWDHGVVALYLIGMVAMGWYFAGREKNTSDFFRGGRRVPWWASGISLFATAASAISLMAMPAKAYAGDWTFFAISVFTVVTLPIAIFFLAPLVRRLNIATANEYLERRFGVTSRLFASAVFCFTQVCGRMAPVMLLPAIALSAITGIEITVSILIMGLITTLYTYVGGLEAVIWTDVVQGLIMVAAVAGCLLLALLKLSMGPGEIWSAAMVADKLHVFDWSFDLVEPVAWLFLVSTAVLTMGYIGDQNFVQRVQCTPTLRDAKKALATQLAVAVPVNVLLFALGTALWLFYRARPEQVNPAMETDGVFPFFVAQQLPPGVSGLVVAALLAATMSTISGSICSVSDLGVNDFYRRFSRRATERSSFLLGRVLVGVVGVVGTGVAILLGQLGAASIWDLALMVTGLITNGIIGLFWIGLLTRRAHELGALLGVVLGMGTVVVLQQNTPVHFLWYQTAGAAVTVVTGYVLSLVLPGRVRDLDGLTVFTLRPGRATIPDEAQPVAATTNV